MIFLPVPACSPPDTLRATATAFSQSRNPAFPHSRVRCTPPSSPLICIPLYRASVRSEQASRPTEDRTDKEEYRIWCPFWRKNLCRRLPDLERRGCIVQRHCQLLRQRDLENAGRAATHRRTGARIRRRRRRSCRSRAWCCWSGLHKGAGKMVRVSTFSTRWTSPSDRSGAACAPHRPRGKRQRGGDRSPNGVVLLMTSARR